MEVKNKLNEYLESISYRRIPIEELTPHRLNLLESRKGFVIVNKNGLPFYINREIEPMTFLNKIVIMEKVEEFTVVDGFGLLPYNDTAENVVEYVKGLME